MLFTVIFSARKFQENKPAATIVSDADTRRLNILLRNLFSKRIAYNRRNELCHGLKAVWFLERDIRKYLNWPRDTGVLKASFTVLAQQVMKSLVYAYRDRRVKARF